MDVSLELEQLREERNRLDAELQLSARLIQQEVGRAREQGTPGPEVTELVQGPELGAFGWPRRGKSWSLEHGEARVSTTPF